MEAPGSVEVSEVRDKVRCVEMKDIHSSGGEEKVMCLRGDRANARR